MRHRLLLIGLAAAIVLLLGGAGLVFFADSASTSRSPSGETSPDASARSASGDGALERRELEGCPIQFELRDDFQNTSPDNRRGAAAGPRYTFTSSERPLQLSVTCRIASHDVEEEPTRFLRETTQRMERLLPGESPERTRISAGSVPGWKLVAQYDNQLIVGNVLARGVRVVLIQLVAPVSERRALEAFSQKLLTDRIEWTVD